MKYVFLVLFVAALAGLEFRHGLHDHAPDAAVCMAPQSQQAVVKDALLQHLLSHR